MRTPKYTKKDAKKVYINQKNIVPKTDIMKLNWSIDYLGSRAFFNKTSQISERYSVYIYALTSEKKLMTVALINISTIKCQKYD